MANTFAEQLETVQAAIEGIETNGQSVGHEGEVLTMANLSTLYAREERLLKKLRRSTRVTRTLGEF